MPNTVQIDHKKDQGSQPRRFHFEHFDKTQFNLRCVFTLVSFFIIFFFLKKINFGMLDQRRKYACFSLRDSFAQN